MVNSPNYFMNTNNKLTPMINIINFEHQKLTIKHWQLKHNESWCILGRNGSGKQYINQLLTGALLPEQCQTLTLPAPEKIGIISFEAQQDIYEYALEEESPDYVKLFA